MPNRLALAVTLLALALLAGCGGSGPASTPEGTVKAALAAIKKGDAQALARLYDYTDYAKRENESWDSIPQGQRDLITGKLAQDRAQTLQMMLPGLQSNLGQATVGQVVTSGDTATAEIKGALALQFRLVQREGKWYLTD